MSADSNHSHPNFFHDAEILLTSRREAPVSTPPPHRGLQWINSTSEMTNMLAILQGSKEIYASSYITRRQEPTRYSRSAEAIILVLFVPDPPAGYGRTGLCRVYALNLRETPQRPANFNETFIQKRQPGSLRYIFENEGIRKVFWDAAAQVGCLFNKFGWESKNVVDLQIGDWINRIPKTPAGNSFACNYFSGTFTQLRSLIDAIGATVHMDPASFSDFITTKHVMESPIGNNIGSDIGSDIGLEERSRLYNQYVADKVRFLPAISRHLNAKIFSPWTAHWTAMTEARVEAVLKVHGGLPSSRIKTPTGWDAGTVCAESESSFGGEYTPSQSSVGWGISGEW